MRRARELIGESQEAFAARLGVSRVTVARWETGERTPSDQDLRRAIAISASEFSRRESVGYFHARKELLSADAIALAPDGPHILERTRLIGEAMILKHRARLTAAQWCLCLALDSGVLKGLQGEKQADGTTVLDCLVVATALEAALRGTRSSALISSGSEIAVAYAIYLRLEHELRLQLQLIRTGVEIAPASWNAHEPLAVSRRSTRKGQR